MVTDRKTILKELSRCVIEFTLKDKNLYRLTLRKDMMPPDIKDTILEEFHTDNPKMVATWNVKDNKWTFIVVDDIIYTQVIDGY